MGAARGFERGAREANVDISNPPPSRRRCRTGFVWALLLALGLALPAAPAESCERQPLRVAVDVGHDPRAFGATSARGRREYDFNLRFAHEFVDLARRDARVSAFLLSPDDPSPKLRQRARLADASGADLLLSIHHDSAQRHLLEQWVHDGRKLWKSDTIGGYSVFVSRESPAFRRSLDYARAIARAFQLAGHKPTLHHAADIKGERRELLDRRLGVYNAPFAVVRWPVIPAVLLEVGVLINPAEEAWLDVERNRLRLILATLDALGDGRCAGLEPPAPRPAEPAPAARSSPP